MDDVDAFLGSPSAGVVFFTPGRVLHRSGTPTRANL